MKPFAMIFAALLMFSCGNTSSTVPTNTPSNTITESSLPTAGYDIVKVYDHDPKAFTQGLLFDGGFLYESTGQYGASTLRKVEITSGKVLRKYDLPDELFGEGIALLDGKIYQLTWRRGIGFIYDINDFKLLDQFRYAGEGWGLTTDGKMLYHSDGTHVIRVVDPDGYKTVRTIVVNNENGRPLMAINELEWVNGEIWANIWHSERIGKPNHIARIDPENGKLLGWIDLAGISPKDQERDPENTLNGIAFDPETERIFVTGKYWKRLYEIKLSGLQ